MITVGLISLGIHCDKGGLRRSGLVGLGIGSVEFVGLEGDSYRNEGVANGGCAVSTLVTLRTLRVRQIMFKGRMVGRDCARCAGGSEGLGGIQTVRRMTCDRHHSLTCWRSEERLG